MIAFNWKHVNDGWVGEWFFRDKNTRQFKCKQLRTCAIYCLLSFFYTDVKLSSNWIIQQLKIWILFCCFVVVINCYHAIIVYEPLFEKCSIQTLSYFVCFFLVRRKTAAQTQLDVKWTLIRAVVSVFGIFMSMYIYIYI